jgi:hypothetical protein
VDRETVWDARLTAASSLACALLNESFRIACARRQSQLFQFSDPYRFVFLSVPERGKIWPAESLAHIIIIRFASQVAFVCLVRFPVPRRCFPAWVPAMPRCEPVGDAVGRLPRDHFERARCAALGPANMVTSADMYITFDHRRGLPGPGRA